MDSKEMKKNSKN